MNRICAPCNRSKARRNTDELRPIYNLTDAYSYFELSLKHTTSSSIPVYQYDLMVFIDVWFHIFERLLSLNFEFKLFLAKHDFSIVEIIVEIKLKIVTFVDCEYRCLIDNY